jgi:hypothetical protein
MSDIPYVQPGEYLFRYMDHRTEYFWPAITDILATQELYLSSRTKFNDPYDCQPKLLDNVKISDLRLHTAEMIQNPWRADRDAEDVIKILRLKERGRTTLTRGQMQNIKAEMLKSVSEYLDQCGVVSLSLTSNNPLLWSHYAANASGVCVAFRRGSSMGSAFAVCAKVSYVEVRPRLPTRLLSELVRFQRLNDKRFNELSDRVFSLSFLHKSKEWEYEREARIFYPFRAFTKIRFDRGELQSIVVGPRSSPDLETKLKQLVAQLAPRVTVQRASLSQSGYGIIVPEELVNVVMAQASP